MGRLSNFTLDDAPDWLKTRWVEANKLREAILACNPYLTRHERQRLIVQSRAAGYSIWQTAQLCQCSLSTVKRIWALHRAGESTPAAGERP
jgi:DNA-directed RNA polymerase specialized sigma24 family protein